MRALSILSLAALIIWVPGIQAQTTGPSPSRPASRIQPVSWDAWLAAKTKAEEYDAAGNLVAALQYYMEYVRQAEGLNSPARVAWGKNNAAYMIIKMHRLDPTVDLAPARKLLEEGLGVEGATEDCRKVLAMNLDYIKSTVGPTR